jgi:sialidase-1
MRQRLIVVVVFALLVGRGGRSSAADEQIVPLTEELRERCLQVLRAGASSDEFWPAMHAAEALTLAGRGDEALAALAQRTPLDDQQRCGLAREAVRAGDRSQIPVLLDILTRPGSNGHIHAAESLFKIGEVGDGGALRQALAQEEDARLRLMAAAALARSGHPRALGVVRTYLKHDDVELQKVAVWVLGQLGGPEDIPAIGKVSSNVNEPLARAYCTNARACLGDESARKTLGENLSSPLAAVRTYSADFAGYARAFAARDALVGLLADETLDVRVRAAQALVALSLAPRALGIPAAAAAEDVARDVYLATAENPRYSEGSIIALKDGALLYATTEFLGGRADHAAAHIVARRSRDGGRTWSDAAVLQENTGQQNVMSVTLRRIAPGAYDGPLGMFYLVKNSPTDLQVYLRVSTDEAQSFGEPIRVTTAAGYHVMNNDRVAVLASGRLVCPVAWTDDVTKKGSHFVSFCYLSDDGGRSWRRSADKVDQPRRGAMEPEVVELAGGKLLMIVRTQVGRIATSLSTDGGEHWAAPGELPVHAPESPATIRRIPATGDLLLVWNNTFQSAQNHGGRRTPLTAAISADEGQTWRHVRNLEERPDEAYAYTSIVFLRDRALLSYYIGDAKSGRIASRFRSLPVRWFYEAP